MTNKAIEVAPLKMPIGFYFIMQPDDFCEVSNKMILMHCKQPLASIEQSDNILTISNANAQVKLNLNWLSESARVKLTTASSLAEILINHFDVELLPV